MIRKVLIMLPLSFLIGLTVLGQEEVAKKSSSIVADTAIVMGKGRIAYKNKIYRQNAPYLMMGYGMGYGFKAKAIEQNMSISYQHFINKLGLQLGYFSSSDTKIWWRSYQKLNDLYIGAGKRWESTKYNFDVFGGPCWSYGSYYVITESDTTAPGFHTLGVHIKASATYKLSYDIGVGLSITSSINSYYSTVGIQAHLYFSNAFIRNYN
jgi:hypothetical protein